MGTVHFKKKATKWSSCPFFKKKMSLPFQSTLNVEKRSEFFQNKSPRHVLYHPPLNTVKFIILTLNTTYLGVNPKGSKGVKVKITNLDLLNIFGHSKT